MLSGGTLGVKFVRILSVLVAACAAHTFSLSSAMSDDSLIWQDNVAGWNIAIDTTIDNSCFMLTGFEGERFLRFQFNTTQESIQLILASPHWQTLESNQDYDVSVAFDDRALWEGVAKARIWKQLLPSLVLTIPLEDQSAAEFLAQFSTTESVVVVQGETEIANLALRGNAAAVSSMIECQRAMAVFEERLKAGDTFGIGDPT